MKTVLGLVPGEMPRGYPKGAPFFFPDPKGQKEKGPFDGQTGRLFPAIVLEMRAALVIIRECERNREPWAAGPPD